MTKDSAAQTGLKWTNIPTKYAIAIICVIIVIVLGTALYGPYRWRQIAEAVNVSLNGKPEFADVVALPGGGVILRGRVKNARDLAALVALVNTTHTLPVYVNYRVSVGDGESTDSATPPRK